ncbi:NusB antitermination factor [Roseivivax marinus]|jgi:N utilization substance protein B|uniref:Transcription antitermination protein NusB n=1 Tax=Roseivivax marinus TaxID=1379903 RepID=W4HJ61_9RHOB|nr:transcription antitermination factor NusB [Roseivivax marinus]ETW12020.1 NusB antitermination factor [Roseivivax marinus]UMA64106.1 transcription antitermination factor NusB [Roseivivax marinus]SEK33166.1 NusB antitermination factor [Roseivivax marinus]
MSAEETGQPAAPDAREMKKLRRSAARLHAVQALFQMEHSSLSSDEVRAEFLAHRFGLELIEGEEMIDGDIDHFRMVIDEAVNWQARVDQMTDRALVAKWPIDRIDPTLRALFRAAGAELVATKTPPKVVIVEYVEIAKAFYPDGREARFVNAVLDHMAREARPDAF